MFIATSLFGALLLLRKVNSKSYLAGPKDDPPDLDELRTVSRKNEIERAKDEAYVNWYMTKLESARCANDQRRYLGTAFMANDPAFGNSNQRSRAVH
jgi:hypothetical protein